MHDLISAGASLHKTCPIGLSTRYSKLLPFQLLVNLSISRKKKYLLRIDAYIHNEIIPEYYLFSYRFYKSIINKSEYSNNYYNFDVIET